MASKLSLVLLLVSSLALLVADASVLRTTVAEIEEENPYGGGSCSIRSLTPCMQWMQSSTGSWDDEMNPGRSDMYRKQCCNMLYPFKADEECMCSALKNTYRQQCKSGSQSFQGQGGMCSSMMPQKLMNVPQKCGFTHKTCHFNILLV